MMRVKGNVVRAWARTAERQGLLTKVRGRLSPTALATLEAPPLSGSWVDAEPLNELFLAVHDELGRAAALRLSRESADEIVPFYTGMLSGLLRVLGTSPASLFSRMNDYAQQTTEGVEYRWKPLSEHSGTIEISYPSGTKMKPVQFLTVVPSFDLVFKLCKLDGKVSEPEILSNSSARFSLSW